MSAFKFSLNSARVLLCLTVSVTQCCLAQEWTKDPTTWWPDPSTGLMWTGQAHGSAHPDPKLQSGTSVLGRNGLNWQQVNDYCTALKLGTLGGWRMPSLDEFRAITEVRDTAVTSAAFYGEPRDLAAMDNRNASGQYDSLYFKSGINVFGNMMIWTSTLSQTDPKSAWVVEIGAAWPVKKNSAEIPSIYTAEEAHPFMGAICVRSMEPDLLAAATAAQVYNPVPDIQTLQNFIPLNKARLAYQVGNYQQSIAQAQTAISLKADPATATWGIGISYGRLGQWDQAIANLQSALAIDKKFGEAETALKWAKDGLKAAKKGKLPKEPSPTWN
jgi:tetratricopeptide (TPR) repeat protein